MNKDNNNCILLAELLQTRLDIYKNYNTRRGWEAFGRHLSEMADLGFYLRSDLTLDDYIRYVNWLSEDGYAVNSIRNMSDRLKALIRAASRQHYEISMDISLMNVPKEDSHAVYCTTDELRNMLYLPLDPGKGLIRDKFLLGCVTGLRVSDYGRLSGPNVVGDTFDLRTTKTKERVIIPIHPIARAILEKYDNDIPPMPSLWYLNKTIPDIARAAGIVQPVIIERTLKGSVVQEHYLKYELITSHTARRTALTLMYKAGIPVYRIMLISGHRTEEAFFRYIRIEKAENAEFLSNHDFFRLWGTNSQSASRSPRGESSSVTPSSN